MSLLGQPDALPSGFRMVCRFLHGYGAPLEENELIAAMSPAALRQNSGEVKRMRDRAQGMLREALALGLLTHDELGGVGLVGSVPGLDSDSPKDRARFRSFLRTLILESEDDLNPALSWLFMQDLLGVAGFDSERVNRLSLESRGPAGEIKDVPWKNLERWAVWLGYAWHHPAGLVPDPIRALRDELPRIFVEGLNRTYPIDGFLERIAEELPVLDRGRVFRRVQVEIGGESASENLSPALSLALLGLQAEGLLMCERRADAPGIAYLCSSSAETVPITHVVLALHSAGRDRQ